MSELAAEVHRDEVDGVPLFWSDLPGPFHAHLVFGVGQAHETLPLHGVTHLVEHLVLSGSSEAPHAYNGMTGGVMTSFVAAGEAEHVVSHLETVARGLADLPTERLEHERQVLRAEAAQRSASPAEPLAIWRWGPAGFGLFAYDEMALRWAGAAELRDWTSRFGRDRAALWLSKPPPRRMSLPLRDVAAPLVPPSLTASWCPLPGAFPLEQRGVSFSLLTPRTPPAASALFLLQDRLEQRLRHELGLVYSVTGGTEVLDGETRHAMFRLDCLPESSEAVQREVSEVLLRAAQPPTGSEWDRLVHQRALGREVPADVRRGQQLEAMAEAHVLGREPVDWQDWEERSFNATPDEVSAWLHEVLPTLVLGVADPGAVPAELATPLPVFSSTRVDGTVLRPTGQQRDERVRSGVVGRQGATLVLDGGNSITVRTDALAGVLCYDDGARHLLGTDGFNLWLAPEEWQRPGEAFAALDDALRPEVRIPAGARTDAAQPQPETGWNRLTWWQKLGMAWAILLVLRLVAHLLGG